MYSSFRLATKYFHYLLTAANGKGHGIHSPFVFELITKVMNDKTPYDSYERVEKWRTALLNDPSIITVEDFGAGSGSTKKKERSISSIARNAAKPRKYGQLLYRLVRHYAPLHILELGTSLGITTSYLASAVPGARVITMEGAPAIADRATQNFRSWGLPEIELVPGNFDDTLQMVLDKLGKVDFAFVDGNHQREPTVRYFKQLLPYTHNDSIMIFDDIHWSGEMEQAWNEIRQHETVRCAVDLFFIGIVVFRREFREKQYFTIRF